MFVSNDDGGSQASAQDRTPEARRSLPHPAAQEAATPAPGTKDVLAGRTEGMNVNPH